MERDKFELGSGSGKDVKDHGFSPFIKLTALTSSKAEKQEKDFLGSNLSSGMEE